MNGTGYIGMVGSSVYSGHFTLILHHIIHDERKLPCLDTDKGGSSGKTPNGDCLSNPELDSIHSIA